METDFNLKSKSPLIFLQSALIAFTCLGSHWEKSKYLVYHSIYHII
jgi:hypothetical protein